MDEKTDWTLEDSGVLKHQDRLVVAEENNLQTPPIAEAHS